VSGAGQRVGQGAEGGRDVGEDLDVAAAVVDELAGRVGITRRSWPPSATATPTAPKPWPAATPSTENS
jgi:hypothetical protein